MDNFLIIILIVGGVIGIIAFTKAVWQWVIGTDVLIDEAKKQTELLQKILDK